MANPSQLLQYFRDCYEADNRETGIANLLSKKFRHVSFLPGTEDLLRGVLDRVPIDREKAVAAGKEAELYRKDKTLIYGAFPLVGQAGEAARLPQRLCAPLVFFPATITDDDGVSFLSVDLTQQRVNFPVLAALAGGSESVSAEGGSLAEDLLAQIPQAPFRQEDIHALISLLMDFLPEVDALSLATYPELHDRKQVLGAMKSGSENGARTLQCLPACALALIPNSPNTRGVLYELAQMADARSLSKPVRLLLGESNRGSELRNRSDTGRVPAVLSQSQQKILASADSVPLTLVVGPPGTGKSYTVAALALDHLSRGESVLIASRMNHAVDVIARKIAAMIGPGPYVIRGGRKEHLRDLKKFLDQILHGIVRSREKGKPWRLHGKLRAIDRKIAKLERTLQKQSRWAKQWGIEVERPDPTGLLQRIVRGIFGNWRLRRLDAQLGGMLPLWKSTEQYHQALGERSRLITELLRETAAHRIQQMLGHHRRDLRKFLRALRSRSDAKQNKLFSEVSLEVLFGTFPIWLTNIADVSETLPLQAELFDLVIIDEATQCDMASCLPVLQRARRAVVVGDPNQLRHVSFLSRRRQERISRENELDSNQQDLFRYREKSILDLLGDTIADQRQVLFLDEHYRSMPRIIRFSNEEFYAGALKVMTQRPETVDLRCVRLRHVPDGRKVGGMNEREAQCLVEEVAQRVEAEAELPDDRCHSLGILSPLRDQVDHLLSLLQKRLSLKAINRHKIMVGTAHTFQGEERDVMYLSLVVDHDTHPATFRFLNNPNIFNVSITRARNEQYVFCSVEPKDLSADTLLGRYLASIADDTKPDSVVAHGPPDAFLKEVRAELHQHGFNTWAAYPTAGMEIDLVAEHSGKTLGIDLIGYPGRFADVFDLERYRMLQRAGLALFPLSYRAWRQDKDACVAAIRRWHQHL